MEEKTLGQILVGKNIITQTELDVALERQKLEKGKYLGQILFEMGVPQEDINKVLDSFYKRKPLGQILIDLKVINPQQLEEALEKQKYLRKVGIRKPVGILLAELGYVSRKGYLQALSKFFNMPIVSLDGFHPTTALQKVVGQRYAQKNMILVLENNTSMMKLALAEPTFYTMNDLQKALPIGKRVEFYLADPHEIQDCLKKLAPFSRTQ